MEDIQQKFDLLKNWVKENGGIVNDKLGIRYTNPENREIYAIDKICIGEKILQIPNSCVINKSKLSILPNYNDIKDIDEIKNISEDIARIFILLYCKFVNLDSFFKHYINILPLSFDYHPINKFNLDRLETYNNISPIMTSRVKTNVDLFEKIYVEIIKINEKVKILPDDILTKENIKWGYLIIRTRQWTSGLCPIADLLQHSNSSLMLLKQIDEINSMESPIDIEQNNVIYDSYGIADDSVLFSTFGFLNKENPLFSVDMGIKKKTDTPLDLFKNALIDKFLSSPKKLSIGQKSFSTELFNLFRIIVIDNNDMKLIDFSKNDFNNSIISLDNESKTISEMQNLIKLKIVELEKTTSFCNDILKFYNENTIEWDLAYLHISSYTVFKNSLINLIQIWNNKISHPYNMTMTITFV